MKKYLQTIALLFVVNFIFAQSDFIPGANVIFEDRFDLDPLGDFPAKWSTSGDGEVVAFDNAEGKWLKISQPTAVSPELRKALPENCTIEFDLYLKNTSGVAPIVMFGLTSLSDVAVGDVYRKNIFVQLHGYNEAGSIVFGKNIQDLGTKNNFPISGYIGRTLHISISINKTRFRVYFDQQKVVDLPKLLTPEYRNNFFIASSSVTPAPEEGIYISNVRIAAGEADARSLLIKQLMEQGSVVTNDIQFNEQTNVIAPESQPVMDQLGQVLQQNPDMNIQINTAEESALVQDNGNTDISNTSGDQIINKAALKLKADKIKAYLVKKFKIRVDRIKTDVKAKMAKNIEGNKSMGKTRQLLTEIIKL